MREASNARDIRMYLRDKVPASSGSIPFDGAVDLASTLNMKSGLRAMGALRPEGPVFDEPVALETAVIATGARPGDAGAKRQLFSEETQTVLVFERGAVIRLSAGVADGQLLFLTNKKSGKEVVTQVVRKRSFRPTSCYVDLEFTEDSPGFWGIEFPKSAPVLPSQVANDSLSDDEGNSVKHAAPPNLQEVERLKKEVAALETQLQALTGSTPVADTAVLPGTASSDAQSSELAKQRQEESVLAHLIEQEELQEQLHGPKRLVAYPKKATSPIVKAASKVATAGALAAVVVAAGIAAYRFGLLDSFNAKATAAKPVPGDNSANLNPAALPAAKTIGTIGAAVNSAAASAYTAPKMSSPKKEDVGDMAGLGSLEDRPDISPAPSASTAMPKDRGRNGPAAKDPANNSAPAGGIVPSSGPASPVESSGATAVESYVAPKLIYSVKPVSPPEALRNYVTGNVSVDALVDVTGHVKSVTVLSGPQKLRKTAISEVKQYLYEPARKNGKPVTAHVQASLKYWYEP